MKNKILSVLLALTLIMGIMPTISFGAAVDGSVVFYNAATNEQIADFDAESSIFAKVNFIAPKTGTANIVVANYNGKSLVGCNPIATLDMTAGEEVSYTTAAISAKNSNKIKVFAWNGMGTMEPLINNPGEIKLAAPNVGGGSGAEVGGDVVSEEVNLTDGNVSAQVPEGVQLANGATALVLSTQTLSESASDIEAGENEELQSIDIHIDGVSSENNVPIIVTVDNFAQEGFNKGNISLYHVEADGTKEMTEVSSLDELTAHNTYTYNPETGTLTMALASFSEIALLSDTEKAWEGEYDYSWYNTTDTSFKISNADQLAAFGAIVGGMNGQTKDSFSGKTITLTSDINLADSEAKNDANKIFYPIGYYNDKNSYEKTADVEVTSSVSSFEGTFDGNGHTISNFYQNTWEMFGDYNDGYSGTPNHYKDAMGLFGYVVNGTVKNLTVDNFSSDGEFTPTGVIAAYAVNSEFSNIAITNCNPRVYNTGNGGIVGIGGNSDDPDTYELRFNNITIDNSNKITALWGSWDVACGGLVGMFRGSGHAYMTNCNVAAQIDVYNDVCGNYQYYWYRYSGMMIGTNKNMITDEDGYTVPETTKFHAENCTVHFGDWNDYYYCELVANSLASYTHDHQFSRLTQVDSIDVANMTVTVDGKTTAIPTSGRYNYVTVNGVAATENATCYHFVDGKVWNHADAGEETVDVDGDGVKETVLKEDRQHYYLPFNQLFTGYGWGVKHIPVYNGENYAFEGITILDRVEATSVVKFEKAEAAKDAYVTGTTVTIGELFKAAEQTVDAIEPANVQVYVSPTEENGTAGATYTPNTTDWTQGTLTFSGIGAATVTITDYDFCTPTTITITVSEVVVEQPVEKFEAQEVNFTHNLTTIESGYFITLGELFKAKDGVEIDNATISTEVTGNATVNVNKDDWTQSEVVLNGTDAITITITDGELCIPASVTITMNEPEVVEKFEAVKDYEYVAGAEIALSDVFTAKSDYEDKINSATVEVTVTGAEFKYTEGTDNWTNGTLVFNEPAENVTVTITDNNYCISTTNTINVVEKDSFKTVFKNTAKYLYRVGNQNAITLSSLFEEATAEPSINGDVTVSAVSVIGDTELFNTTFAKDAWTSGTIKFDATFTGPVEVTIDALGANPYTLYLEVVDATNITSATSYSGSSKTAFVLLNDVSRSDYAYYWNCTLYGNGFTYSLNGAPTKYSSSHGHGVLITKNATLDNVVIKGDVYESYGAYTNQDYCNAAIDVMGDTIIQNCYISNCAAPIVTRSNVTIKNTTLYGGTVANLLIKSGTVTLEDVTTVNYDDGRKLVGMGIVAHSDVTDSAKLIINGTLKQYNFVNEDDKPSDEYAAKLYEAMFGSNCSQYHFGTSPNRYVNTGIISMSALFNREDITDNANTGYVDTDVTISGYEGCVYTQPSTTGNVDNGYDEDNDKNKSTEQGDYLLTPVFDLGDQAVEGDDRYLTGDINGIIARYEEGQEALTLDITKLMKIYKYNNVYYDVTAACYDSANEPVETSNGVITLNAKGSYTLRFTVDDNLFYSGTGEKIEKSVIRTYDVPLTLDIAAPSVADAIITISNNEPKGSYCDASADGSKNLKVNLLDPITITDNGEEVDLTKEVKSDYVTYANTNAFGGETTVTVEYNEGQILTIVLSKPSSNAPGTKTVTYTSSSGELKTDGQFAKNSCTAATWSVKSYSFKGKSGKTVTNDSGVTFTIPADTSGGGCVTPDTLVTLSDGSQRRIDEVTYEDELLLWNFYTGEYDVAKSAAIYNHGTGYFNVVHLNFDDGTTVKVIKDHGFFDVDANRFVFINEENVGAYVGRAFVKQDGNSYKSVKLESYEIVEEYTTAYALLTTGHYNCILEGMFTQTPPVVEHNFFMPFELGDNMKYDEQLMKADIEKYGLTEYEEFAEYVSKEDFENLNFKYLAIWLGKGLLTYDELMMLVEAFVTNK